MSTSMELTKDSWTTIVCKTRFTAFSDDKFTIHKLENGNPAYSPTVNQRHTNLVFYDKALPYPEQDSDAHICLVGTGSAGKAQTGIILENPNPWSPGLVYMKPVDFIPCGGYYFIANYGESLYHKARMVAFFNKEKPMFEGWKPVFSYIVDDCKLARVFVSDKRNPETGRVDAKLCIFYLGDLVPFHYMGPTQGYMGDEFSTTCTLINTIPLEYTLNQYSRGAPAWKWTGHGDILICIEAGKLTTHTVDIYSDSGDVTSRTASSMHITLQSNVSFSDDGTKLFIHDDVRSHNHDMYYEDFDAANDPCIELCRSVFAFNMPELTPSVTQPPIPFTLNYKPTPGGLKHSGTSVPRHSEAQPEGWAYNRVSTVRDYATNWVIDDVVALSVNWEDKHYHLSQHLDTDRTRVADLKTHFDLESGVIVRFTFKNVTPGLHYICIGSCADKGNYVYTIDTNEHAIYAYQLASNIDSWRLTQYDCTVFGDGTLFIGGFRKQVSYYHSETITYAVKPTMVISALKTAPIPDELIRLTMSYLTV